MKDTDHPQPVVAEGRGTDPETEAWQVSEIEAGLREAEGGEFASREEVRQTVARWCDPSPTP